MLLPHLFGNTPLIKKIISALTIFILIIGFFYIQSGNAAIIDAASCSQSDLQAAINSAVSGDIIVVPSGSCTWSSSIIIPNSKKITLQGSGMDSTIITSIPPGTVFSLGRSGSRITGFGFINGSILADGNDFRIDHCKMSFDNWSSGIIVESRNINPAIIPTGVIDSCIFFNMRVLVNGTNYMLAENGAQHGLWAGELNLGSAEAVYIEDNTFINGTNAVDGNYGGRYVFRYNKLIDTGVEAHSVQGINRAIRKWEIYGNEFIQSSGYRYIFLRGGTGVVFNNTVSSGNVHFILDNVRSFAQVGPGLCDGTIKGWDENTEGQGGWRCRDQIGIGGDREIWNHDPPGANTQYGIPAYFWGNYKVGSPWTASVVNNSGHHIQNNRDYYDFVASGFDGTSGTGVGILVNRPSTCKIGVGYWATDENILYRCSAPNIWEVHYKPYLYPHPLRKTQSDTPPEPPRNLRISK